MKPTPETDKFFATFCDGEAAPSHAEYYVRLQDLERERDEARFDLDFRRRLGDLQNQTINNLERELDEARGQRDRLADLVKQFISILDITEESDSGRLFHPTNITSCRAGDLQKIGELVEELRRASLHQPTES